MNLKKISYERLEESTSNFENQLNISIDTLEQYIKNRNIPKKDIKEIYQIGSLSLDKTT